jgi:hypothetical protein
MDMSKPRVAIYYHILESTGRRNDGAALFSQYNLKKILDPESVQDQGGNTIDKDGHRIMKESMQVLHLQPQGDIGLFGKFDLNLLIDYGEDGLNVPLDFEYPHPNAYWVSDAHLGYDYRLKRAKEFDYVFCAQKDFIEKFANDGVPRDKLYWLPHAVEPLCYKPISIINKWDWAFIGYINSTERLELLDRMTKEFPSWYLGWRQPHYPGYNVLDDVSYKFNQANVILNQSIKGDINMRTFEAMATKRCLLTSRVPHLDELFIDGAQLVTYSSIDEAIQAMGTLLKNPDMREHIAGAGYDEVIAKNTYEHRMLEILEKTIGYKHEILREEKDAVTVN